jgi:hypothetical protein
MTYSEQADRVLVAQLRLDEIRRRNSDCIICGKHIGWRSGLRAAGAAVGIGSAYTRNIGWCWPCWHRIVDRPPILSEDERAEAGYITVDCPECRADRHLPARDYAPRTWYYCTDCRFEWTPGGPDRDWPMIISGLATIAIIIAMVLGSMLETAAYAIGHHWSQDGIMGATLLGAPLGVAAVLVLSGVFHLLNNITYAVYEYVWGPPLSWFDTVPRRPRA